MADAMRDLVIQDVARGADVAGLKGEVAGVEHRLTGEIAGVEQRLRGEIAAVEQRLTAAMETLALRLTVRMGVMLAAGLSLIVALIGPLIRVH